MIRIYTLCVDTDRVRKGSQPCLMASLQIRSLFANRYGFAHRTKVNSRANL